ncbi:MAG TPA: transglutaminase family protein [Burkholderiales bacterium]
MQLKIDHLTTYTYDSPVRLSTQYLRLTPRDTARQKVLDWTIETPGNPVGTFDGYGNVLHVLTLDVPVTEIRVRAFGTVETSRGEDAPSDFAEAPLPPALFLRETTLTKPDEAVAAFAEKYRRSDQLGGLREFADAVHDRLGFSPGYIAAAPDAATAMADQSGTFDDLVHVFIAGCHQLGVPARYVSGWLCDPDHPNAVPQLHAWAEAHVQGSWRSFDVAMDEPIGDGHIKVAIGADHLDACPIRGIRIGGGLETMFIQARLSGASSQ